MANQTFSIRWALPPSPWSVGDPDCDGRSIVGVRDAEGWVLADLCNSVPYDSKTQRSVAHVFAAAPELYEVLDTVRHQLLISGKTEGDQLLDLVTSVMRKARGEK